MNSDPDIETGESAATERWVLVASVLASSMAFIDATALNVALPAIQSQTQATGSELFWIVNAYAVVLAGLILFGGACGDRFGRQRVFSIGIALFVVASAGCGFAPDIHWLIAMRSMQGLGAALMIPGSLAMIATATPEIRRGRAIGIWSACSVVMTALGPILGGLLTDAGWWRAVFLINLPIGLLALALVWAKIRLPESSASDSLDLTGALWSVLGLGAVNFAMLEAARQDWFAPTVLSFFALGSVCLGLFVWVEKNAREPLLPLSLLRNRNLVAASVMTLCFYSGLYGMLFFLALNLIQIQGYAASTAGLAQLPLMLLVVIFSPLAGITFDRFGARVPLAIGGVLAALGFAALAMPSISSGVSEYWNTFFPAMVLLGVGMGMAAAPLSSTVINSVRSSQFGIASGINSALSRLSNVIGIATLGPTAVWVFRDALTDRSVRLPIKESDRDYLAGEMSRLADASPPPGLTEETSLLVQQAIDQSFVDAFRCVSILSAILVLLSTVVATLILEGETSNANR